MIAETSQRTLRSRRPSCESVTPRTSSRNQTRNKRYINFTNTENRPFIAVNQNNEPELHFPSQNVGRVLSPSSELRQLHNNPINVRNFTAEEIILQRTETVFGFLKKVMVIFIYLIIIILILLYMYSIVIKLYNNSVYVTDYTFNTTTPHTQCPPEKKLNGNKIKHFTSEILILKKELSKVKLKLKEYYRRNSILENKLSQKIVPNNLDLNEVKEIISEALAIYDADKIGRQDFALASTGAYIIKLRNTIPFLGGSRLLSFFGFNFFLFGYGPKVILQPNSQPGNCFAFFGDKANIQIQLAATIYVEAFTMEHISKTLIDDRRSAPRLFSVWGITNNEQVYLGTYEYKLDGPVIQTFEILNKDAYYPHRQIELRILSNYGNNQYTCLYRFRVHGKPFR